MSFHLIPSYHSNMFPFSSFNDDLRAMRKMLDVSDGTSHTVEPSYSCRADDKAAHFEIEMPGVSKENISIDLEGHKLVVKGKRFRKQLISNQGTTVEEEGQDGENAATGNTVKVKKAEPTPLLYLLEARLAQGADIDAIKADHCGDGILTITVPMKTDHGARKIQIGL